MNPKTLIPFSKPYQLNFSTAEKKLLKVLRSPHWSKGKYLESFEKACEGFLNVKHAVAVSSCTSGLSLALASVKKPGEVIVPGFTFAAVVNAVVWNGLKPRFVDVDPIYGNLDPNQVESAISSKTAAIIPVCNYGFPPDFDKLEKISRNYKIPLIIDSAQSFGTSYNGKKCGVFGKAEVFSLSLSKILTTAEGGIVVTNNNKIADFVRKGRNYGKSENGLFQFAGLSCRLSEFHSIIGLEMIKNIKHILKSRSIIAGKYYEELQGHPGISLPPVTSTIKPSFNYLVAFFYSKHSGNDRNMVLKELQSRGIDARKYFSPPVYKHPAFKCFIPPNFSLKVCEKLASRCAVLPIYPGMSHKNVIKICRIIKNHVNSSTTKTQ